VVDATDVSACGELSRVNSAYRFGARMLAHPLCYGLSAVCVYNYWGPAGTAGAGISCTGCGTSAINGKVGSVIIGDCGECDRGFAGGSTAAAVLAKAMFLSGAAAFNVPPAGRCRLPPELRRGRPGRQLRGLRHRGRAERGNCVCHQWRHQSRKVL
jgi:hypothetical protein